MPEPRPTPPGRMTLEAFLAWAEAQPRGRHELVAGEVVAMAPERIGHLRAKAAAWLALRAAIAARGLDCEALPDGATVVVGEDTAYEPDAMVTCGERQDADAVVAANPVIVVEVVSPGSRSIDTVTKLADYFRVPSVQHYLILMTDRRLVIHHRRGAGEAIETRLVGAGPIALDPPGIAVTVEALFEA